MAKADMKQQSNGGVNLILCVARRPIRPVGLNCVEPSTMVADLRTIRDWEVHNGTRWVPYGISGEYLNFLMDSNLNLPSKTK